MPYQERLTRYQQLLQDEAQQIDLVFLPVSADLQYLTGVPRSFPNFGAIMHPGAWLEGIWLTPTAAPVLTLSRMTAEFGGHSDNTGVDLRVLGEWGDPADMVSAIAAEFKVADQPCIAIGDFASGETITNLNKLFPGATFVSATDLLRPLRTIKSADEIAIMRQAGAITEAAFTDVIGNLRLGMTELDVVTEVDYQLKRHGAEGPSFTTSLYNVGPNHELIFGQPAKSLPRELTAPVSLLFDFGAIYQGYCYDFGRTVAFGEPDAEFLKIHELVMASQAAGIAALRAGEKTCAEADAAARQVIIDAGYGEAFRHRLGHAIGLDVHEPPFLTAGSDITVQEGMLFTVEPSVLVEGQCSARVEDVIVARPGGGEPLTSGFQSLIVVE